MNTLNSELRDLNVRNRNINRIFRICFSAEINIILMEMVLEIALYHGRAGTGKTYKLTSKLREYASLRKVVLTPTHSALENIKSRYTDSNTEFSTIYSYFRIDYKENKILGVIDDNFCNIIFIDEFSLIDKNIFDQCVSDLQYKSNNLKINCRLYLFGDPLQLSPVSDDTLSITFNEINDLNTLFSPRRPMSTYVLKHMYLSLLSLPYIQKCRMKQLIKQMRSSDQIMKIINNIYCTQDPIDENLLKFVLSLDVPKKVMYNNYVYIASTYKQLQYVYDHMYAGLSNVIKYKQTSATNTFSTLYLFKGLNVIACETKYVRKGIDYYNGEEFTIDDIDIKHESINALILRRKSNGDLYRMTPIINTNFGVETMYFPITPSNLLTIHKAQGRGFDNVIMCIDNLFEITMMYTGITRAKTNLLFHTQNFKNRMNIFEESAHRREFHELYKIITDMSKRIIEERTKREEEKKLNGIRNGFGLERKDDEDAGKIIAESRK